MTDTGHSAQKHQSRRHWLKAAVGTTSIAVFGYLGWRSSLSRSNRVLETRVALGPVTDYPSGAPPKLKLAKLPNSDAVSTYIVQNMGQSEFVVRSAKCTHLGCIVDWQPDKVRFVCPCHGGVFDSNGRNVGGPPKSPLKVLLVVVENGHLFARV